MKKWVIFIIVMGVFLFAITGCIVRNQSSANYSIKEGFEFTDTYSYNVEDDFKGMKLKINLTLTKGKVSFELKDPNGDIKWSGDVNLDEPLNEVKSFDKITGEWTLTFENVDNSGEGELNLQFNRL
ncbi:MAG: hypothetical protein CVV02_17120 [Firmicutes bacterium HGW-Firmicutes-7]|nr:MAG: hypothetical protein CVV02_17120 [Firmicutes bacterium HGW-Firmicutes-7]